MATKIVTKNSSTASAVPTASDLVQGELAVNVADKRLFTEDNGGSIVELGTNPSTIDINAGSIDGTAIGASSASTGAFTTLTASGLTVDGAYTDVKFKTTQGRLDLWLTDTDTTEGQVRVRGDANNLVFITNTAERMRIDSSGRVLLNRTASTGSLTLESQAPSGFSIGSGFYSGSTQSTIEFKDSNTTANYKVRIGSQTDDMVMFAGGSERLRIDSSGNVGIGTSSPSHAIDVSTSATTWAGAIKNTDATNGFGLFLQSAESASKAILGAYSGSSYKFYVRGDGNVGIGTSSPVSKLDAVLGSTSRILLRERSSRAYIDSVTETNSAFDSLGINGSEILFETGGTERARIDSSGNLLVGTTSSSLAGTSSVEGIALNADSTLQQARNGVVQYINRLTTDGDIVQFRKNGSTVGSIGTSGGDLVIGTGNTGLRFLDAGRQVIPINTSGVNVSGTVDLGSAGSKFDDIYATNGTIQTSDRNEKQDIAELSEAEQRVAVACKGLLRKFRWKDSVAEKGDDARIHFGIMAQDLQAAFEDEGLDAGDYAMFTSTTWTDEETNEEKTRMGVRYSELLAFIISAI